MSVRRTAAALLTAGLLLTGCSDDPEPRFEPTETPSPTESSATAEPQAQSPEEFIREWVELDRALQQSGDVDPYLAASSSCGSCRDFANRVQAVYDAGGSIKTQGWAIQSIDEKSRGVFSMRVTASPTVVTPEQGGTPQRYPRVTGTYELHLRQDGDSWQVTDWFEVES
jgi:hypothetical protein